MHRDVVLRLFSKIGLAIKHAWFISFTSVENQKHLSVIRQILSFYAISSRKVQEHVEYGSNNTPVNYSGTNTD